MKTDPSIDLGPWTRFWQPQIERILESRLPAREPGDDPGRLVEAMRYSLLAPGKRLRPLVALAAAEAVAGRGSFGVPAILEGPGPLDTPPASDHFVLVAAASVELIHCYSLIHDDLPAMDDDDLRRGRPTCHKQFDEATAILAGDALLTLAFDWLAEAGERSERPLHFARAARALARGAGVDGMVRGQARDLGEPPPTEIAALERLHGEKTAALFRAAAEVGAAAAGGSLDDVAAVGRFGERFGLAFQHTDDREDGDHRAHALQVERRLAVLLGECEQALEGLALPARGSLLRAISGQLRRRAAGWPVVPPPTES